MNFNKIKLKTKEHKFTKLKFLLLSFLFFCVFFYQPGIVFGKQNIPITVLAEPLEIIDLLITIDSQLVNTDQFCKLPTNLIANPNISIKILAEINTWIISTPLSLLPETLLDLHSVTCVKAIEFDKPLRASFLPNDEFFNLQENNLLLINARDGWDLSTGSEEIIVAVIDSGIDQNHTEFHNRIVPGYDFFNHDSNPQDDDGHGTMVAGIIAAEGNNSFGVAGISWYTKLMPIKVLNHNGSGTYGTLIQGIIFAVDNGANVINLSLGGFSPSTALENTIDYAVENDVIIVAAAGNYSRTSLLYPAQYPAVISVGSVDDMGNHSWSSHTGEELDLVAPGENIYSTTISNQYAFNSGTSFSTPFVSGAVANLLAVDGTLTIPEITDVLISNAQDLGEIGWDPTFGYGLLNIGQSVSSIFPEDTELTIESNVVSLLPETGFSKNYNHKVTVSLTKASNLNISIPSLKLENISILGVSLINGSYDVSWLGNYTGYLSGTTFPTLVGNSVLVGHVNTTDGREGIFSHLSELSYGDEIHIYWDNTKYVYTVQSSTIYAPQDVEILKSDQSGYSILTLITCQGYDDELEMYHNRLAVRAILTDVVFK